MVRLLLALFLFFPLFAEATFYRVASISINGNNKTHSKIILRELDFEVGDSIKADQLDKVIQQANEQVFNTFLFIQSQVKVDSINNNQIFISIQVKERWYVFPVPILEFADRNFNQWYLSRDPSRLNYGLYLRWDNVRGRRESLRLNLTNGYTRKIGIFYRFPFIFNSKTLGLDINLNLVNNREIGFRTEKDKLQFYNDDNLDMIKRREFGIAFTYRKKIFTTQSLGLNYYQIEIADTVTQSNLNPNFLAGGERVQKSLELKYLLIRDRRDYRPYPLKGDYTEIDASYNSLGLKQENINPQNGLFRFSINYRKYFDLGKRQYFSLAGKVKVSNNFNIPYFNSRALGYEDYLRGYEYYVIDGSHFALLKLNYKINIIKPGAIEFKFIPIPKFNKVPYALYFNLYSDVGYVENRMPNIYENTLNSRTLNSYGAGFDFVTYYDRVVRFEYSLNTIGDQFFYLHFKSAF